MIQCVEITMRSKLTKKSPTNVKKMKPLLFIENWDVVEAR